MPLTSARAQELEPRLLSNLPVGANFGVLAYNYARGNILLDPAVPVEDLDARLHTVIGAYARAIDIFGLSGKVDVVVPFAGGDWTGVLDGQDTARVATGFGDPRIRLSVNFVGAPALRPGEFRDYQQKTVVGASVQVIVPVGQYDSSKLLNLGSNRWTFRTQLGVSHTTGLWTFEGYGALWLFTHNTNYFGGSLLEQRPLFAAKIHVVRSLPKGFWLAFGAGYGSGGRGIVDGDVRDNRLATFRLGLTLSIPLARRHSLQLFPQTAIRSGKGSDFDAISLAYQYRWGGGF
jgi:hypothetical protein